MWQIKLQTWKGVRCRPARSSTDVCQRGAVHQRIGGGNTPCGVSPHPQGARLALRLVCQGGGKQYTVSQPLLGDSLPFLLTSVADKELLRAFKAPGAVHVYAQCSYGTQQRQGWTCLLRGQCLQVHHLIAEGRGGNLRHVSRPGSQDNMRVGRPEHKALFAHRKCLEVPDPLDGSERVRRRPGPRAMAAGASRRGRMCWIASVCFCTAENCWAKPSTVSPNSPAWEMGASRKRALATSFISARLSQRWHSWTTMVDIAFCWPPARYSRLPGQAWPSALGPVRQWRQHPRGAAPPNLHPQRT